MEYIAIPLSLLAIAFLVNGLPDINIGNTTNKYYNKKDEK